MEFEKYKKKYGIWDTMLLLLWYSNLRFMWNSDVAIEMMNDVIAKCVVEFKISN